MRRITPIVMLFFLLLSACSRDKSPMRPKPTGLSGTYSYTSYDSTDFVVAQGWLTLTISDSLGITGEWHIQKIGDAKNIGPQIGDGELIGELEQKSISMNLNPDWADNNVLLRGILSDNKIDGK